MAFAAMTQDTALRYGFPAKPRIGQQVRDSAGRVWVWYPPQIAEDGLAGDGLGFWGAIISSAIGLGASIFGGGSKGKVSQAEAQAAVDKARLEEQLAAAQQPRGAEALFNKKTLPYWSLLILGFVALR
jgi:hypothetical protein